MAQKDDKPRIRAVALHGGLSELEKEIYKAKVQSLNLRVDRRAKLCEELEENISIFRKGYEQENADKEFLISNLVQSFQEALEENKKFREAVNVVKQNQDLEINGRESKIKNLKEETERIRRTLTEEISGLEEKRLNLEGFKAETDSISKRIQDADKKCSKLAHKFQQEIESAVLTADELYNRLKYNLLKTIETQANDHKQLFSLKSDSKYYAAIEESVRLEEVNTSLSKRLLDLKRENEYLRMKISSMSNQHKIMIETRHKLVDQEQGLIKGINLLRSQFKKNDERIRIAEEKVQNIKFHKECIDDLKNKLQSFKKKLHENQKEWQSRETYVYEMETKHRDEKKTYIKIISAIRNVEQILKREIISPNDSTDEIKSLKTTLEEMFDTNIFQKTSITDDLDIDMSTGLDKTKCDIGSLALIPNKNVKLSRKYRSSNIKVHIPDNIEGTVIDKKTFDIVEAQILSELGLLNKFFNGRSFG